MKKITIFLFYFLFISLVIFAYTESEWGSLDDSTPAKKIEAASEGPKNENKAEDEDSGNATKKSGSIMGRSFEIGLAQISAGFSNDFLSTSEIFKETLVIDLDKLQEGLNIGFYLISSPIYFNINRNNWGFGLNTKVDVTGNIGLSGKMLSFKQAVKEKSDLNAAAFAEIGISGYFTIYNFKIKVKPSIFYPVIYLKSDDISYTNKDNLYISYNVKFFTAWDDDFNITASPGFDLYAGVEYPLAEVLGLSKIPLLDFGVGIDFYGIRLVRATIKNYTEYSGHIGSEESLDIFGGDGGFGDDFLEMNDPKSGTEDRLVARPFRLQAWADWRPLFGSQLLTIYPLIGFSVNPIFNDMFSMEYGIKGRLNLFNIFIAELAIKHEDRLWQNCLDLALNLKFFELDLGVNMKSASFIKSWSGGGFGVNFGMKFGW